MPEIGENLKFINITILKRKSMLLGDEKRGRNVSKRNTISTGSLWTL
jgi:hypothetical protein